MGKRDTLGRRLKRVRNKKLDGISASELGRRLKELGVPGADHASIGAYEADQRVPSAEFLAAFVQLAKVDGHWLLTGEGEPELRATGEAEWRLQHVWKALEAPYPRESAGGPPGGPPGGSGESDTGS